MILFDELGLAEKSRSNPLKVLHSKLEYSGKEKGVSFVGISNYSLDAAKVNRALILTVSDLDQHVDELIETAYNIVESISDKLKNDTIFRILSKTYFEYKNELQIMKELIVYNQYIYDNNTIQEKAGSHKSNSEYSNIQENNIIIKDEEIIQNSKSNNEEDKDIFPGKLKKRDKRQFEYIKELKEFKDLYKKENKIRKDFHGNRDFYNLIKGIAIEFGRLGSDHNDDDKLSIIEKYIERNFGGIDYEIDIDLNLKLDDIRTNVELITKILEDYDANNKNNKKPKLTSVFLFKKLYNFVLEKEEPYSNLLIKNINNYNLNECINDNIKDINSRFLLLEIKQSLSTIIYQNIRLQNPFKDSIIYDGSPFSDDNNKEYRFKKINQIQDNIREDKLIILENINQIHPFLFDLYNMNYIIKDEKKFARICLEDKFSEQLSEVNDRLRIIILVDKKFVDKVNLAFLNRFEKMILSFEKLLENNLKNLANKIRDEMNLKKYYKKYEEFINFSLKDLLINCGEEEIKGLVFYFSKVSQKNDQNLDDESKEIIKENVFNKIYKILPQDIISILPDNNIIRKKYFEKKDVFNYKDYIAFEDNKNYKISIIYTYTSIANTVEGLDDEMSFMISEINSEDGLKNLIDEIKIKNENNKLKKDYNKICIHFEQSNSKKLEYISNFILKNFKDDKFNYILIIHINRNFKKNNNNEPIYSLSDINPDINQIFIDNLNGSNSIKLKDLLGNNIQEILNNNKQKLDEEFDRILRNYLSEELKKIPLNEKSVNDYISEIQKYINEEESIKEKIIEISLKLIGSNKEQNEENEENKNNIIENLYKNEYINIYSIDIVSCLVEYLLKNIFNKKLKIIFEILENNNILTTLLEIKKNEYKYIKSNIVENIINKYLDEITLEKNTKYKPKFLFNYNVPGFYNFYIYISNYINRNITLSYFNNEKNIRELLKPNYDKIKDFYEKEESLLFNVYKEIEKNNKFIFDCINKIDNKNVIFQDYITYYLQKYKNKDGIYKINDKYHKIIELLLQLRFKIKNNENNHINILLKKIIWIESNVNYILKILKIFEFALEIFNNDKKKLYKEIEELIFKENIKYIINNKRNPEHTREVNECYYILLASFCYSITSDKIILTDKPRNNGININSYHSKLKEINKILQNLNDDLYIFLNEMYIIDELIKIIEILDFNIEKINKLKDYIRENSKIIQKYSYDKSDNLNQNNDAFILSEELYKNFEKIYNLISKKEIKEKSDKDFYDKLKYIFLKEIKKISDINYRYQIFEKLIEENQMIKKSNDIFQILLKNYLKKKEFKDSMNKILNGDDEIITLIEIKLKDNFILSETLLYFFEKNSLIYLKANKNIEDEPLEILKECVNFLYYYIFKKEIIASKLKEICKLFCLGYIKTYSYSFINKFNDDKWKNSKNIIKVINENNSIYKMIRIYIFKILYNYYTIDAFINEESIRKYELKEYKDFEELIKIEELNNIYKIDYEVKSLKNDYIEDSFKKFKKFKENEFNNEINKKDFNIKEFGIDNFYIVSYDLILSNLKRNNFEDSNIYKNFYKNICKPLFQEKHLLLKAIQLLYDPESYSKKKQYYNINSNNITPILYGYRYVLNELSSENKNGIYYPIYNISNADDLKEKFYPGNDTKYSIEFYKIVNHFKSKPNEGCYICLCKDWYYHSIPSGFPGLDEISKNCGKCKRPIGAKKEGIIFREIKIIKRNNYFRIFKDEKEIEKLKNDNRIKEINYLTLEQFKEKYLCTSQKNEKGVFKTDKNSFKNDNKIIRNLSSISYRLLNYILYIHLFFARIITNNKKINDYLPKDYINNNKKWIEIINECWIILENELKKEKIFKIEEFMNYIFTDLFLILNKEKKIDDYEKLIEFEDKLESHIQIMIQEYKKENNYLKKNKDDYTSFINLLKEKYNKEYYKKDEFPFYEYFYYTDYLNESYINGKLKHMDETKYPVLKIYLESLENEKGVNNNYSLDNLDLFNKVLNLYFDKYSNHISREFAEKTILKTEGIYIDNTELIDNFFKFYNDLKKKDSHNKEIQLNNNNYLGDLFINDSRIGKTYKEIYKNFIKEQNKKIENLLEIKINNGIFDDNCQKKINIQQINEKEIFTCKLPKKISFIDILFNSSYRKIIDTDKSYESYRDYEINYDLIEENLTDLLLKNKKLLNDEIIEFAYNNEVFSNEINNIITSFKNRYIHKDIDIHDKVAIYKFTLDNKNIPICKDMICDFIKLVKFLNEKKRENSNEENVIKEENKLYEIVNKLEDKISEGFIKLFERNDGLTVDKIPAILDYYLKLIYENVNGEIKKYQQELNDESKNYINNYFKKNHIIKKKDFAYAIRLFITLVLFPEEDKENKIKSNCNNVVNYLKVPDFWDKDIYNDKDFDNNLNELKLFNSKINQIISLYEFLGKDIESNFCEDVKKHIEEESKVINNNDIPAPKIGDDDPFSKANDDNDNEKDNNDEDDDPFAKKKKDEDEDDDERD